MDKVTLNEAFKSMEEIDDTVYNYFDELNKEVAEAKEERKKQLKEKAQKVQEKKKAKTLKESKKKSLKESKQPLKEKYDGDYVVIYYSTMNGSAIAYETYDYDEFVKNKDAICKELLSYDENPMDLDIQVFDKDGYYLRDFDESCNESKKLNERYDDTYVSKNREVTVTTEWKRTRYKTYMYSYLKVNGATYKGLYSYINRPWEVFDYQNSTLSAIRQRGGITEEQYSQLRNCRNLQDLVDTYAEMISSSSEDESLGESKQLKEVYSKNLPDWFLDYVKTHSGFKRDLINNGLDLNNMMVVEDDAPLNAKDRRLHDPNLKPVFLFKNADDYYNRDELRMYIPGVNDYEWIRRNWKSMDLGKVSKQYILDNIVHFGYIDMGDPTSSSKEKQSVRQDNNNDMYNRYEKGLERDRAYAQHKEYDSHWVSGHFEGEGDNRHWVDGEYVKDTNYTWETNSGYDKSGYKKVGLEQIKKKLYAGNLSNYGKSLDKMEKVVNELTQEVEKVVKSVKVPQFKNANDGSAVNKYYAYRDRKNIANRLYSDLNDVYYYFSSIVDEVAWILKNYDTEEEKNSELEKFLGSTVGTNQVDSFRSYCARLKDAIVRIKGQLNPPKKGKKKESLESTNNTPLKEATQGDEVSKIADYIYNKIKKDIDFEDCFNDALMDLYNISSEDWYEYEDGDSFIKINGKEYDGKDLKAKIKDILSKKNVVESCKVNKCDIKKSLKEATQIDITDEEDVEKGKEILKDNQEETGTEEVEQIVDVDAETVDQLKDSYVGNVILQCPVCRTLVYKKPDLLNKDEENLAENPKEQLYNLGEQCPHCGSEDGYYLVGQVASMDVDAEDDVEETTGKDEPFEDDNIDNDIDKDIDRDIEDDTFEDENNDELGADKPQEEEEDEEVTFESLDIDRFNDIANTYLTEVYSNVDSFTTTNATVDDTNNKLVIEGVIKYKSGKSKNTKFEFLGESITEDNKYVFKGLNETFAKDNDKAFTLKASIDNSTLISESLDYDYTVTNTKLNESKVVKGSTFKKKLIERIVYEVHSDVDENNVFNQFEGKGARKQAIDYAKKNGNCWVEKHWYEKDEDFDTQDPEEIWNYLDESKVVKGNKSLKEGKYTDYNDDHFGVLVYKYVNDNEEHTEEYDDPDDIRADFIRMTQDEKDDYEYVVMQEVTIGEDGTENIEEIDSYYKQ